MRAHFGFGWAAHSRGRVASATPAVCRSHKKRNVRCHGVHGSRLRLASSPTCLVRACPTSLSRSRHCQKSSPYFSFMHTLWCQSERTCQKHVSSPRGIKQSGKASSTGASFGGASAMPSTLPERARWLAEKTRKPSFVGGCASCHGPPTLPRQRRRGGCCSSTLRATLTRLSGSG